MAGDAVKAKALDDQLLGLHKDLFIESNPIPVKWAVAKMNLMKEGIRLPLTWLSEQYHGIVTKSMERAHVL